MIRITDFNELMADMVADITASGDAQNPIEEPVQVAGHVLVANEKHLVKRLGDNAGVWLAVTIPSADPASVNEDNIAENNIVWMFILEKKDPGSMTAAEEISHYQKMQDTTAAIKNWLRDRKLDGNELIEYIDLRTLHTDPEYQFGGWNGWSINFNFDTDGY